MSAIQPKSPLSVEQAQGILETLSLLNTEQHKASKLVFYDTKIVLEADSSTWRTANSWTSPVTSTVWYYAGYPTETGSRKLDTLPSLMERVHAAMTRQAHVIVDYRAAKLQQEMIEKAETGLSALKTNKYQGKEEKTQLIETALATVRQLKESCKTKSQELFDRSVADIKSKGRQDQEAKERLLAEQNQELERLRKRNAELETIVAQEQKTVQAWFQLIEQKLAEKDRLLASVVMSNTVDLEKVPTITILAMQRVLLDILAAREPKK